MSGAEYEYRLTHSESYANMYPIRPAARNLTASSHNSLKTEILVSNSYSLKILRTQSNLKS